MIMIAELSAQRESSFLFLDIIHRLLTKKNLTHPEGFTSQNMRPVPQNHQNTIAQTPARTVFLTRTATVKQLRENLGFPSICIV